MLTGRLKGLDSSVHFETISKKLQNELLKVKLCIDNVINICWLKIVNFRFVQFAKTN